MTILILSLAGLYGASNGREKRMQVFGSLFHAKSLSEVYLLTMGTDVLPRAGDLKASEDCY